MSDKSVRDGFGDGILKLAQNNPKVVVVSTNLANSTRVSQFSRRFPSRFFEVGVAEQNGASVAAGLALGGKTVFLTSFACFSPGINWGQIRQSICFNNANVVVVGSHAGLATGPDGATHQALEDIALARCLPKMTIISPIDYTQAKKAVLSLGNNPGPTYLRLARPKTPLLSPPSSFELGKIETLKRGTKATIIGTGPILAYVYNNERFQDLLKGVKIVNCHTLKPIDKQAVKRACSNKKTITLEDHQINGGLGSVVAEIIAEEKINTSLVRIGMDDKFGESARNYLKLWEKYYFRKLEKELK
jgi:transketolase